MFKENFKNKDGPTKNWESKKLIVRTVLGYKQVGKLYVTMKEHFRKTKLYQTEKSAVAAHSWRER